MSDDASRLVSTLIEGLGKGRTAMATITGRDSYETDLQDIQSAISSGETQLVLEGTFNFGLGDERKTLFIDRPLTIMAGSSPPIILGGGLLGPQGHAGVFVVANGQPGAVVIKGLRFEQSRSASIVVVQCHDVEISECVFVDGQPGWNALLVNANGDYVHSVSAVVAYGAGCAGRFLARTNRCSFGGPPAGEAPDDEQFIAIFGTSFDVIEIRDNVMSTRDDGIEVLRNGYAAAAATPCELTIVDNTITIDQRVGVPTDLVWPAHAAIVACLNGPQGAGPTRILDNTIVARGPNVSAFILSGENITVKDNEVTLQTGAGHYPTAPFVFGFDVNPSAAIGHMGASLRRSVIVDNTIVGSAPHAIWAWDDEATAEVNDSSANEVRDNNFAAFASSAGASVDPASLLDTNTFVDNAGL